MKTENQNARNPLAAALLAFALALSPAPALAQQTTCATALSDINDYSTRNGVSSIDQNNPNYRSCCLAIRVADASREAVRICEAEGVDNAELRQLKSALAGLPSSLPLSTCNAQPGGSSSCREYPAVSFTTTTVPDPTPDPIIPPIRPIGPITPSPTIPDLSSINFSAPDLSSNDDWIYWGAGAAALVGILIAFDKANPNSFAAHPILSYENDNGRILERYGMRIEHRLPDSPLALNWSVEESRTDGVDSSSLSFGGEWRGEVWTFGGEAAQRDSRAVLALRAGAALARAGWTLRLDANAAAWSESIDAPETTTEFMLGMEKAF